MPTDTPIPDLLAELTLEEKCALVHGARDPEGRAAGYIPGVERLDIPPFRMVDGPLGVGIEGESATAFPAGLALAATFDTDLARDHGAALGRETKGMEMDSLLAPGTNLIRVPENGRNFEYFSEDPLHSGAFAAAVTAGIESEDVVATPKHYVANNQETDRATVDVDVSERALHELYLPAFRDAVEAGAGAVMTAYNAVNGTSMSEHDRLINDVLKGEFGFEGYTVSDWFATEDAVPAVNGGLDVEMPGITMAEMMAAMGGAGGSEEGGPWDGETPGDGAGDGETVDQGGPPDGSEMPPEIAGGMPDPSTCERYAEALRPAVESGAVPEARLDDMVSRVLTRMASHGVLDGSREGGAVDTPAHRAHAERVAARGTVLLENDGVLPLDDDADVALIGPNIEDSLLGGGGSSETDPAHAVSPREGIAERAAGDVCVEYGLPPVADVSMFDMFAPDGDDEPEREPDIEGAARAAEDADVAVVFARDTATEAIDREGLSLPGRQDELIEAVAAANSDTAVVLNTSGPVETPWRDAVGAVLEGWYPGQAHGTAAAAVLYGDTDPGGRLPVTFAPAETYPTADPRRFPGEDGTVHYDEGVFVGYRAFDAGAPKPDYPFGHGESYAEFAYTDATVDGDTLAVTVENTSERDGREVVQAYVRPPETDGERPVRELAGFAAVDVAAGERETVEVALAADAFRRYDEGEGWVVDSGAYTVEVGRSSRDARLERTVTR